jgi:orotate phosphoribosyltransferase
MAVGNPMSQLSRALGPDSLAQPIRGRYENLLPKSPSKGPGMTTLASLSRADARRSQSRRYVTRDPLEEIIFRKSFGRGAVTLSSGKTSTFYFDMKPSMFDPEGAHLIAERILREATAVGAEFIGGLEMGAVPITGAVCQLSDKSEHPIHGFFVRKSPKEHGAKKLIEGLTKSESLSGKRVVIVDDVTTSGGSALVAVQACKAEAAKVVMVISIVDREEGAAELFAQEKIKFTSLFTASTFLDRDD